MSIVALGELLIDFVALEEGVYVGDASGFQKAPGGAPANVAVAVARLGLSSGFLGQVGDDPFGQYLTDVLQAEGVDVSGLSMTDEARTMLAFVALGDGGERSFSFYRHPSADMLYRPEDVNESVIQNCDIFHFGSITLISEPARSATLRALELAQQQNKLISYDPNLRLALWDSEEDAKAGMLKGFEYAHVIKVSEEELEFLTGGDDPKVLMQPHTQIICVTKGENGSDMHLPDGRKFHHRGYAVKPVDTTGAGDGFMAGLLVGIREQRHEFGEIRDYETLLPFANAVGAIATTQRGAIPALPTRAQVDQFMRAHQH